MESLLEIILFVPLTVSALQMNHAPATPAITDLSVSIILIVLEFLSTTRMFAQVTENALPPIIVCATFHILEMSAKTKATQLVRESPQSTLMFAHIMEPVFQTTPATAPLATMEAIANIKTPTTQITAMESQQQIHMFAVATADVFITIIAHVITATTITCVNMEAVTQQTPPLLVSVSQQTHQMSVQGMVLAQ